MTKISPRKSVMFYATVDSFAIDRGAAALSIDLASSIEASVTAMLLNLDANAPAGLVETGLQAGMDRLAQRESGNRENADAFVNRAAACGVPAHAVTAIDHSRGVLNFIADHARLHDVVVTGSDSRGLMSDRLVAQDLLFHTGRPQIVVPADWTGSFGGGRIVCAWDNTPVAARALFAALDLLPSAREVILLVIGGEKAIHSSLDIEAAAELLARRGIAARGMRRELGGRSIGAAIQEEALGLGADLLAMGAYAHSRLRDLVLGGATLDVIGQTRLPVLLSH